MAFQYSELVYLYANEANIVNKDSPIGSISAALSCLVYPPREEIRGRSAGSFPEQRLVTEPKHRLVTTAEKLKHQFKNFTVVAVVVSERFNECKDSIEN